MISDERYMVSLNPILRLGPSGNAPGTAPASQPSKSNPRYALARMGLKITAHLLVPSHFLLSFSFEELPPRQPRMQSRAYDVGRGNPAGEI